MTSGLHLVSFQIIVGEREHSHKKGKTGISVYGVQSDENFQDIVGKKERYTEKEFQESAVLSSI